MAKRIWRFGSQDFMASLRLSKSRCVFSSGPWGFEGLHAYISRERCRTYYCLTHNCMYWIWDLRPSIWDVANCNYENWPYGHVLSSGPSCWDISRGAACKFWGLHPLRTGSCLDKTHKTCGILVQKWLYPHPSVSWAGASLAASCAAFAACARPIHVA